MLHLARKAFWPAPVPFSLLHVDTGHNFPEVLEYRDEAVAVLRRRGSTSPRCRTTSTTAGCASARTAPATRCRPCRCWTRSRAASYDAVFGGGRRDEERARAKERVFSCATSSASGTRAASAPSCGRSTTAGTCPASTSGSSRCPTGPSWTSGTTSRREKIELPVDLLRPRARGRPARRHVARRSRR